MSLFRRYRPLNLIEISEKRLTGNYKYLARKNNIPVAPVLKSNAYGHGLLPVAKILEKLNPPFFCVDSLYEAYELEKDGIKTPILVMGYVDPESLNTKTLSFSFSVFTKEQVDAISKFQPDAKIHIFVDTGMHREGVRVDELESFLIYIKTKKVRIEGVLSHYAESEAPDSFGTKKQIEEFEKALTIIKTCGITPRYIHIANSSGILNSLTHGTNIVRAGLALYGVDSEGHDPELLPVLTFTTKVAQVKNILSGESIGYNFTYEATNSIKIAILPVGYNDGVDRHLSNKGFVKIKNKFCRIVGRVSMNITIVDVSEVAGIKPGDEVIVFSNNPNDKNSIQKSADLAKMSGIIPYDLMIHLHPSTKRISS